MNNNYDATKINAILDGLIYDRTQSDVDYALMLERENIVADENLRGAYNASDRNRVAEAINYIAGLMRLNDVRVKDDWDEYNIVRVQDNADTIYSLNRLKQSLPDITILPPEDLDRLSYIKANAVERILFELYGVYERANAFFVGDGYASDFDVADGEQAFDDNWEWGFTL